MYPERSDISSPRLQDMRQHMLLPSEPPQCDHRPLIEEINQAHELAIRLRAFLLPSLQVGGSSGAELIREILDELVKLFSSSLFRLHSQSRQSEEKENNTTACTKRKTICCHGRRRESMLDDVHKKKKKMQNSWSKISSIPFEDGYLWRKYGQKNIRGAKYPRSYYRCIYSDDQGCPARKTVEQEDIDEDPPNFTVVYSMQHTCQSMGSKNISIKCVESGSASFQSFPPSCGSTTVDNNDNHIINARSEFSSGDGDKTTHQLVSEISRQELPLESVGFEWREDETVVDDTSGSTIVDNNDNHTINKRSEFSSGDGDKTTHQVVSEISRQELPLESVGFEWRDDETVVDDTSLLAAGRWLDDFNNKGKATTGFFDFGQEETRTMAAFFDFAVEGPLDNDSTRLW